MLGGKLFYHPRFSGTADPQYLLLVGNSGVGKSFIGNALLGTDTFRSSFQVDSLTRAVQRSSVVDPGSGQHWVVVDMPGLIEANAESLRSNEEEMGKAFAMASGRPVVVAFVITLEGGRMQPDQLGTVRELMSRVQGLSGSNSLIIANKIDDDAPENGIRQTLQYHFPSIPRVCLVKFFRGSERRDFSTLHRSAAPPIFASLRECTSAIVVAHDIQARRQAQAQAEEAERAARELRDKQAQLAAEKQRAQRAREEEMLRRQQEADREARRLREEQEREARMKREELEREREEAEAERRWAANLERRLGFGLNDILSYNNSVRAGIGGYPGRGFAPREGHIVIINGQPCIMHPRRSFFF